jgi:hypothetical protein
LTGMLNSRLARLERRGGSGDPMEELTDAELHEAIAFIEARILEETGMTANEYRRALEEAGKPVVRLTRAECRALVDRIKRGERKVQST